MTEPTEPTPEEIAAAANLAYVKQTSAKELILFLNGLTTNALSRYPQAEVQSWTIQREEALALTAAGEDATVALAPLLTKVCEAQHGEADGPSRLAQVVVKGAVVLANAEAWGAVAAYVNGLRARTESLIETATSVDGCLGIIQAAKAEAEAFRAAASI